MYNTIWLVNISLSFYLISSQNKFSNRKKKWCHVRNQWCQQITAQEHLVGEFALAHLTFGLCTPPTDTSPFTYHPFNGPGMCVLDNFQLLRFGNNWSPDKFTGNRKTKIIFLRLHLHFAPSTRSMAQPDISKGVHLPPITTHFRSVVIHCHVVRNINVTVNVDLCFTLFCELVGRLPNLKRWKFSTAHMPEPLK